MTQLYLCKYLINCVENDPKEGDYYNEANNDIMRRAGLLLNEIDGKAYMMDSLLAYVPKRYRRSVEHIWDGIGGWRAQNIYYNK